MFTAFFFLVSLFFCLVGAGWLVLALAAAGRDWRTATNNRQRLQTLWKPVPPLLLLGLFGPPLLISQSGPRNTLFLVFYLAFIILVLVPFFWGRNSDLRRSYRQHIARKGNSPPLEGPLQVKLATTPEEFAGAGEVFATAFGRNFDEAFGRDRASNARLLAELLRLKQGEVYVALTGDGQVAGSMWLDLGEAQVKSPGFKELWPILRRYLDIFNAFYGACVSVRAMMSREGNRKKAYVHWLGVRPEAQGQGVGYKLLELAEQRAKESGHEILSLHTESSNAGARKLYRQFGMREAFRLPIWPQVSLLKRL